MTGTLLSRVICYFRGLINAAGEFSITLGGEENSGALRSQIYTMPKAYYTAPSAAGEMGTAGEIGTGIMCPFF